MCTTGQQRTRKPTTCKTRQFNLTAVRGIRNGGSAKIMLQGCCGPKLRPGVKTRAAKNKWNRGESFGVFGCGEISMERKSETRETEKRPTLSQRAFRSLLGEALRPRSSHRSPRPKYAEKTAPWDVSRDDSQPVVYTMRCTHPPATHSPPSLAPQPQIWSPGLVRLRSRRCLLPPMEPLHPRCCSRQLCSQAPTWLPPRCWPCWLCVERRRVSNLVAHHRGAVTRSYLRCVVKVGFILFAMPLFWVLPRVAYITLIRMAFRRFAQAGGRPLYRVTARRPHFGVSRKAAAAAAVMRTASTALPSSAEDLPHQYAVPKVDAPTLAVVGSHKRFPVRRVYCVGSNYRCVQRFACFFTRKRLSNWSLLSSTPLPLLRADSRLTATWRAAWRAAAVARVHRQAPRSLSLATASNSRLVPRMAPARAVHSVVKFGCRHWFAVVVTQVPDPSISLWPPHHTTPHHLGNPVLFFHARRRKRRGWVG